MHPRTQIREAVVEMLRDVTGAGVRVYPTRKLPIRKIELPLIAVYTLSEDVTEESQRTAPLELDRRIDLTIECWVKETAEADIDRAMDEIALEVEAALAGDRTLGGTAADAIYSGMGTDLEDAGDRQIGLIVLRYEVSYQTFSPAQPTAADDFETAGATYKVAGKDMPDDDAVNDAFTVEEDA